MFRRIRTLPTVQKTAQLALSCANALADPSPALDRRSLSVGADNGITGIKINRDGGGTINDANLDIRLKGPSAYVKVRF